MPDQIVENSFYDHATHGPGRVIEVYDGDVYFDPNDAPQVAIPLSDFEANAEPCPATISVPTTHVDATTPEPGGVR